MKKQLLCFVFVCAVFSGTVISGCVSSEPSADGKTSGPDAAAGKPGVSYYSGDGGGDIRLAVLVPEARGLTAGSYLPDMVQGVFVTSLAKYSGIEVLDRLNLDKVLAETESGIYKDDAGLLRFGQTANVNHALTGTVTKTASGSYALQVQIVPTTAEGGGVTKASYSGACTAAELENFTAIKKASADLLAQLGVRLTDAALKELSGADGEDAVKAQTALARGITAERGGTVIEAMSYYYEAARFDPSLAEAANRSSVLSADIAGGNIGQNVRNEIQARSAWDKTLKEAAAFFKQHPPYEIFYNPALTQEKIDFYRGTANMSFQAVLSPTIERKIISDLEQGLEKAVKTQDWGLRVGLIETAIPDFFDLDAVLIGEGGETIGSAKGRIERRPTEGLFYRSAAVTFENVDANKISDTLTVSIVRVNGIDAKTAGEQGYIRISTENFSAAYYDGLVFGQLKIDFRQENAAKIVGYEGDGGNLVIPAKIERWAVTSIGARAFLGSKLTGVTIPDSVTAIGGSAFHGNQLTSVTIPNSVTDIEGGAFKSNQLTSVTIPDSVTYIGAEAFENNQLTSVTIPNSVTLIGAGAFRNNRLTSITIPNSVTDIRAGAFQSNQLTSVTVPDSVTSMVFNAFARNPLTRIILPANMNYTRIEGDDRLGFYYETNGRKGGYYLRRSEIEWAYSRSVTPLMKLQDWINEGTER